MNLFKRLRQTFCLHDWIPMKIIDTNIYNKYNIRYARCHSVCAKCDKEQNVDFMMRAEFQDKWND